MQKTPFSKVIATLLGPALMISGGWAILTSVALLTYPLPVPPPSLVGVKPAPLSATAQLRGFDPARGTIGVPVSWTPAPDGVRRGDARVNITTWRVAPGIPLRTAQERRRAVELDMRADYERVTAPREVAMAGRPALEIAGADRVATSPYWILATYAFVDRVGVRVTCTSSNYRNFGGRLSGVHGQDWEEDLPGCAAVIASLKVNP